jgi:hypothetical protein
MISAIKGTLPWPNVAKEKVIFYVKSRTTAQKLCSGLPDELIEIYNYIMGLGFYDVPDYERIYTLLETARGKVPQKDRLDWESLGPRTVKRISAIDFQQSDPLETQMVFHTERDISGGPQCNVA